jgi:hypothetical protein
LLNVNDKQICQVLSFVRRVIKVFPKTSDNNKSTKASRSYAYIGNYEAETLERKGEWL